MTNMNFILDLQAQTSKDTRALDDISFKILSKHINVSVEAQDIGKNTKTYIICFSYYLCRLLLCINCDIVRSRTRFSCFEVLMYTCNRANLCK